MKKFESAKAAWPRTRPVRGGVRISGRYLPPGRVGAVPGLYVLMVVVQCALLFADTGSLIAVAVWVALMTLLYVVLWRRALTNMLSRLVDIRVFPDRIEVQHALLRRKYSRSEPIAFSISRFEDSAIEVVMQYGERRIVIAEMPLVDTDNAEALLARLREAMSATDGACCVPMQRRYSPYSSAAHLYG